MYQWCSSYLLRMLLGGTVSSEANNELGFNRGDERTKTRRNGCWELSNEDSIDPTCSTSAKITKTSIHLHDPHKLPCDAERSYHPKNPPTTW